MKLLNLEPGRQETIINAALKEFALNGFDKYLADFDTYLDILRKSFYS